MNLLKTHCVRIFDTLYSFFHTFQWPLATNFTFQSVPILNVSKTDVIWWTILYSKLPYTLTYESMIPASVRKIMRWKYVMSIIHMKMNQLKRYYVRIFDTLYKFSILYIHLMQPILLSTISHSFMLWWDLSWVFQE